MKATGNELDLSNFNPSGIVESVSSGFSGLMKSGSDFFSGSGLDLGFLNNPAKEVKGTVEEGTPQPSVQPQSPMIPSAAPKLSPAAEPQSPAIPPPTPEMVNKFQMAFDNRDKSFARGRIESAWKNMSPVEQHQAKRWVESKGHSWSVMKLPEPNPIPIQSSSGPISPEVLPFVPQSPPKPNLGNLSEPPADIVVLGNNEEQSSSVIASNSQTITDVPLIPSGNPDNFYTLYSQVNYNVVF